MNAKNDYIAVFDSGLGGLTVLRELLHLMPNERYLYFGDAANAPYGSHSTQEVREFTLNCTRELMAQEVKALVVACNTATSAAIDTLRRQYPDTIIIGIEPALKVAVDRFPGGNIAVMATPVTLREEKFRKLMNRYAQNCKVTPIPAPGLVELIETGHIDDPETDRYLSALLGDFRDKLDAVVLGCTHYPFAAGAISRILGTGTVLIDGGAGTAREPRRRLEEAGLLSDGPGELLIRSSSSNPQFFTLADTLLMQPVVF